MDDNINKIGNIALLDNAGYKFQILKLLMNLVLTVLF